MSKQSRRNFSALFKAKVALEAIKERYTLAQLAAKYELHPTQITEWKKQMLSSSQQIFEGKNSLIRPSNTDKEKDELYKQIGQLKVENDWLKKKSDLFFNNKTTPGYDK